MAVVYYKETPLKDLDKLPIIEGQLIYCPNTDVSFYDGSGLIRIEIKSLIVCDTELDRVSTFSPVKNRLYAVRETSLVYRYTGMQWIVIKDTIEINDIVNDVNLIVPVKLEQNGQQISPEILSSSIRTDNGLTLEELLSTTIKNNRIGVAVGSVVAQSNMQRSFEIPFPFPDYLRMGNSFICILGMSWVDPTRYTISNNRLVFNDQNDGVGLGRKLSFIFIFNSIDPTEVDLQAVDGSYIADRSIPLSKLEESVQLSLTNSFITRDIEILNSNIELSEEYSNSATYYYGANKAGIILHLTVLDPSNLYTEPLCRIEYDMVPKGIPIENIMIMTDKGPTDLSIDNMGNIWLGAVYKALKPSRIDGTIQFSL